MRRVLSAGLFCAASIVAAAAAEPASELPAGGLAYASHQTLVTDREDIVIAADRVRVSYVLRNTADEARSTLIAFALPDIDMLSLDGAAVENPGYDPQNASNFVGFWAQIDSLPVELAVESRALALGLVDATAVLQTHNLPLYPLHPDLAKRLAALPDGVKSDLSARSLIRVSDGQLEPQWTFKTTFFWLQAFAAGQERSMSIGYRPIAGASAWAPETGPALQQRYCVPAAIASQLNQRAQKGDPARVRWVHFLANTGAGARGAVRKYRLALETTDGQSVFTCRPGLVDSARGGTRETTQSDHVADDEIQVLYID